ncbi:hypothetical protein C8R46DRAFT_1066427 [Mycena filopes]|nr:hypothetical protein C8R46DRAFT_1066427 [Mycena filopes]
MRHTPINPPETLSSCLDSPPLLSCPLPFAYPRLDPLHHSIIRPIISPPAFFFLSMPFSKTAASPPQTAKSLARMHVQAPAGPSHQIIMSWFQPRKAPRQCMGYRRPAPTPRLLSIGRRHPSGNAYSASNASAVRGDDTTISAQSTGSLPSAALAPQLPTPGGASVAAAATSLSATRKPHLYASQRSASGSPRWASSPRGRVLVSSAPKPAAASHVRRGALPHSHADDKRRQGVPLFTDELQAILRDVLLLEDREEQEEVLLRGVLAGRVVGGESRYQRVKMVPAPEHVETSAAWMTTIF